MKHAYFGVELDESEVKKHLDNSGLKYKTLSDIPCEVANWCPRIK
jgi:predicted NodU family carbamoyl transferase